MNILRHVLLLTIYTFFPCFAGANDNIQSLVNERIAKNYNVGIIVAVIKDGKYEFYSAGRTSKDHNAKSINKETIFPIASITKVFTTYLLAQEILENKIKLSDPASKYLDIKLPEYQNTQITIEDLATHYSGLPSNFGNFAHNDPYANLTVNDLYNFVSNFQLTRKPGSEYEYCDIGIGLLGNILTKLYNQPYDQLVSQYLTKPLEMNSTQVVVTPQDNKNFILKGYKGDDLVSAPYSFPILASAGAIYSNAEDLAKFVLANMRGNSAFKLAHQYLRSEGSEVNEDFPGEEQLQIGLAWNIDQKHNLIWKNGNMMGFSSFIGFNNVTKTGVVVLANTGNVVFVDNLAMHILNSEISLLPLYQEIKLQPEQNLSGRYYMDDKTSYEIRTNDNNLTLVHITKNGNSQPFNIYPMSASQYFGKVDDSVFKFTKNCFDITESGKTLRACK